MAFIPDGSVGLWFPGQGDSGQRRGTVLDQSGQNNHATIYGAPCLSFDGVNDVAAVGTPWDALVGSRYALWCANVYVNVQAAERLLYIADFAGQAGWAQIYVSILDTDKLFAGFRSGPTYNSATRSRTSSSALSENAWHSIMILFDCGSTATPTDTAITVWDNGALLAMDAITGNVEQGTFAANVPVNQRFGLYTDSSMDFLGRMQWLGYGSLTVPATITDAQRYYDDPDAWLTQSGLAAYWYCKEDAGATVDNAQGTAGRDLALTGTTWSSYITSVNGGNARNAAGTANSGDSFTGGYRFFDGVDDCLQITDAASLRFGNNPYQIHVWATISSANIGGESIIGKGDYGFGEWFMYLASGGANTGKLAFYAKDAELGDMSLLGGSSIMDDTLHLLSVLRNGNDVYLYVDGAQIDTDSVAINLNEATKAIQVMATDGVTPCKGNVHKVLIGTANKTIAQGNADMLALLAQGPYI